MNRKNTFLTIKKAIRETEIFVLLEVICTAAQIQNWQGAGLLVHINCPMTKLK